MSALPFIEAIKTRDEKFYKLMKDLQEHKHSYRKYLVHLKNKIFVLTMCTL